MVAGIALFRFLAGSLASLFVEHSEEQKVDPKLAEISERLEPIERPWSKAPRSLRVTLRTFLHGLARFLGDVRAVNKGRVGRRIGRRVTGKTTGRLFSKLYG